MQRRSLILAAALASCGLATVTSHAQPAELRVVTHNSFSLPKPLLAQFEAEAGVKLAIVKAGDAGEMLNKLILTRAQPIADVVFGLDNASIAKAARAGVIDAYDGPAATRTAAATLGFGAVPVDYGHVTLNIDLAWFAKQALAAPASLEDLTRTEYRKLVVVQNPATSSPGLAFLASTIAAFGEEAAFDWWRRMRDNEVKVAKGWSEAYYTDFTRNGGTRPIVVSYASSPAAEVFYSKTPLAEAPTRSLALRGAVFRQVEAVALVKGGGQREAAGRFIEFLRSPAVQEALQTSMWMLPVEPLAVRADVMRRFAPEPERFDNPTPEQLADRAADWVQRWTRVVLR
jgi:thiamine transport system substrate-binding protein